MLELPELGSKPGAAAFDATNPHRFMVAEANSWHTYVYTPHTTRGPTVKHLGRIDAIRGAMPLVLTPAGVAVQLDNGRVTVHSAAACASGLHTAEELPGLSSTERERLLECVPRIAMVCCNILVL